MSASLRIRRAAEKGLVGLELKARGLKVELEIYEDEVFFSAQAGIVATAASHDQEQNSKVYVTDDGCLTWIRDYWAEATYSNWIADPAAVAGSVVKTITSAMSYLPRSAS